MQENRYQHIACQSQVDRMHTVSPVLRFPLNTSPASTPQIQYVSALLRMKYTVTAAMIHGDVVASQCNLRSA